MEVQRPRAKATTILFPLIDRGTMDFESTPVTFVAADTQISKDEGAFTNTGSTPSHEGNGIYSLALTAVEMTADRIVITCIDGTDPKLWEDQAILIQTRALAGVFGTRGSVLGSPTPTVNVFTGDTGLPATTDLFAGVMLIFDQGTANPGSGRLVERYTSGRVITVLHPWAVTPAAGNTFTLVAFHDLQTGAGNMRMT